MPTLMPSPTFDEAVGNGPKSLVASTRRLKSLALPAYAVQAAGCNRRKGRSLISSR